MDYFCISAQSKVCYFTYTRAIFAKDYCTIINLLMNDTVVIFNFLWLYSVLLLGLGYMKCLPYKSLWYNSFIIIICQLIGLNVAYK